MATDTPAPAPPAAPPRRRGRWLVRLGLLVAVAAAAVGFAPAVVARTALRDRVLNRLLDGPVLDASVTSDSASLGWLSPVEFGGVTITGRDGVPVLTGGTARSSKTLLDLIRDRDTDLGTFTVSGPELAVRCRPGGTNVEDALAPLFADDGTADTGDRLGVVFAIVGGKATLTEPGDAPPRTVAPFDLTVTVPRPRAEPIALEVAAGHAATGRLGAVCRFGPASSARVVADKFPADSLGPVARRFAPGTAADGRLTADVSLAWGGDAGLTAEGTATADGLDLAGPWLGADRLRLARVEVREKLAVRGGAVHIDRVHLACDAGTATVVGVFDPDAPPRTLIDRPGQSVAVDVDVAKLAALLPSLLRVRPGTELHAGRVKLNAATVPGSPKAGPDGTTAVGVDLSGSVEATALRGTRDGRPLAWDQPLSAAFAGRVRADGLPEFDRLDVRSDFVGLTARGSADGFTARADLDLDRLAAHLAEFVDLGGVVLAGKADLQVTTVRAADGTVTADGTARLTRFTLGDGRGGRLTEPDLAVAARGTVRPDPAGPVRLAAGTVAVTAGTDRFEATLREPVADLRSPASGRAAVQLAGDLGRWKDRAGRFAALPPFQLAGTGTASADVTFAPDAVGCDTLTADLAGLRFRGFGLDVNEAQAKLSAAVTADRKAGSVTLADLRVSCPTVGLSSRKVELVPGPGGTVLGRGELAVTGNVRRLQQTLGIAHDIPEAALHGTARGTVGFDLAAGGKARFTTDLTVALFAVGPEKSPLWSEPSLKLTGGGEWDPTADVVTLKDLRAGRDGLSAAASGRVAKPSVAPELDLTGSVTYDLARLEPKLREYLGKGAKVSGAGTRPFAVKGPLTDGGQRLAVQVGQPRPPRPVVATAGLPPMKDDLLFDDLTGSAAVGWQAVKAFGFDVGPAELTAALLNGTVELSPVDAAFGGGKVRVQPTLTLNPGSYDLTLAPGRVVDKANLTPETLDKSLGAVGYALPAFANVAQARGTVSFDLAPGARIPLVDPTKADLKGNLLVHSTEVTPGPLVTEILALLNADRKVLATAAEQTVPIAVKGGVVYHADFKMMVERTAVTSRGAVGIADGKLTMELDVQFPPRVAEQLFRNNPRIRDALLRQTIKVPVGGTIDKPQIDPGAFRAAIQRLTREATKDAAGNFLEDLLKKK